jgi:hypothetical protein
MPARRPVLIVEGGGDASAVPLLVRRITEDMGLYDIVPSSNPLQAGDASVLDREGRLEKFVSYASRREDGDSVLIALDFDVFWTQCVANIARGWSERIIANAFPQRPVAICFFVHEYEALILKSLSDVVRAYPNRDWHVQQAVDVQNPEAIRGTKEAICRMLRTGL